MTLVSTVIKRDITLTRSESLDFDHLKQYEAKTWLEKRPSLLLGLIKKLCNIMEVSGDTDYVKTAAVFELIYGCWSPTSNFFLYKALVSAGD